MEGGTNGMVVMVLLSGSGWPRPSTVGWVRDPASLVPFIQLEKLCLFVCLCVCAWWPFFAQLLLM